MSACPNCGAIPGQSDRYCNTCGTALFQQPAAPQAPSPSPYGAPPSPVPAAYGGPQQGPPQGHWGGPTPFPAPTRCQLGHDIAPGQNYCAQGHPLALEGVQFAGNAQPYPPQPPVGYAQGYAAPYPSQGYPAPAPYPGQYGAAAAPPYAPPHQQGYAPLPVQPPQVYAPSPLPQPPEPMPSAVAPAAQAGGRVLRGFLVSFQSNPLGEFWPLYGGRTLVGRSNSGEALDVPLADATISSRHGAFVIDPGSGSIQIEDTGSTNGTFVNDEHLGFNGRRELRDGDRVRFGGYTTLVKVIART